MKTLKASFGRTVQRYYFAGSTQESRMRFFYFMKKFSCPSAFLFDSRFTNTDKIFAMLIMASESQMLDYECAKILGISLAEILESEARLTKHKLATRNGSSIEIDVFSGY
jgi:hypothetical protein